MIRVQSASRTSGNIKIENQEAGTVFITSDFAKDPNVPNVVVTAVFVHELGNKLLAEEFIRNRRLFAKAKSNWLR